MIDVVALRPSMKNSDRAAPPDLPRSLPEEHCGYLLPVASEYLLPLASDYGI